MKKLGKLILGLMLVVCMSVLTACKATTFENPGDYLGGGGTGESATAIDVSDKESATEAAATTDLSALSEDTDSTGATSETATTEELVISEAGDYMLAGNYGGVHITATKNSAVHIFLNGANITATSGKALYSDNKISATITIVEGTTNTIINSGDDVNAVHIKGSLNINGSGKLNVTSNSKSGIKASGVLKVVDADITINAAAHGLTAQTVIAEDCKINVTTGKDGIQAESSDYEDSNTFVLTDGYVSIKNVEYTATTQGDGIQADTFVYIDGGTYSISTNGTWVAYSTANISTYGLETDDFRWERSGSTYKKVASDEVSKKGISNLYALSQGCKGIKVGELEYTDANDTTHVISGDYNILIKSGTFTIDATDDAIHTNGGDTIIRGGTYTISTLDDGIASDGLTQINDGTINITTSYEGIEGAYVEINGGSINLYATDDGINAASDDTTITEHIIITGGTTVVKADGDGIDSNGSIQIDGGVVVVHGTTSGADAALDADTGILVNGGYLFATGSLGMVETPSSNSTQYVVSIATKSSIAANTTISIKNSSDAVVSVTTLKSCQSIIVSCPEFERGASYTIYGGTSTIATFTISSIITQVGSTSSGTPGGGPGGPGGFGR